MTTPSDSTTKTTKTTKAKTTKTTPSEPYLVFMLDMRPQVTGGPQIDHTNDGQFCCMPVVAKLCETHYSAGVLLGTVESVVLTAALAVATGKVTVEQAMSVVRESERTLGHHFPLETWDDIMREGLRVLTALHAAGELVVAKASEDAAARAEQPTLN